MTTTLTALDIFLVSGLVVSFIGLLAAERGARYRDKELMNVVRRVDVMLYTWAMNWGATPEAVKMALLRAIRQNEEKYGRRKGD